MSNSYATMELNADVQQNKSGMKMNKYAEYMMNHSITKNTNTQLIPTHTRIGNESMGIFSGKFHISDNEFPSFMDLYYEEIFVNHRIEYLTEKQLDKNGPILVDLDFRFALDTKQRIYTEDHLEDLIELYLIKLKDIFQFDDDTKFEIYLFEKKNMVRVPEKNLVKDGIHMYITLQADHVTQQILRKQIMTELEMMWDDMPIINTWDDVLDVGIAKGHVNWQVFGSRKPGSEP